MNFRKNLQYDFPKNEGGGSKTVWNFSENSSVLEGKGVPYFVLILKKTDILEDIRSLWKRESGFHLNKMCVMMLKTQFKSLQTKIKSQCSWDFKTPEIHIQIGKTSFPLFGKP